MVGSQNNFTRFIIFVVPVKQSATSGSLCPLSINLSIRLSRFAFAGATCGTLVIDLTLECS